MQKYLRRLRNSSPWLADFEVDLVIKRLGLWIFLVFVGASVSAQQLVPASHVLRSLDGENGVGEYFDLLPSGSANRWTGWFYVDSERALYAGSCTESDCALGRDPLATGSRGKHVVAIVPPGNAGRPLVAFYDEQNGDLRLGVCFDAVCSFFSPAERVLDSAFDVGRDIAMAINPVNGFALISYYRAGLGGLYAYVCADAACTAGTVVAWDASLGRDRGRNSALAFGANLGSFTNVFVVYDDTSNGEVLFARANPPFSTLSISSFGPGRDAAISVGPSGLPDIVFTSASGGLVRIRCLNFGCQGTDQFREENFGVNRGLAPAILRLPGGQLFFTSREAGGIQVGFTCPAAASCIATAIILLDSDVGSSGKSISVLTTDSRRVVFLNDQPRSDLRVAACTDASPGCGIVERRTALRGFSTQLARVALRPDGRAVATWVSQRDMRVGSCADLLCNSLISSRVQGFNSDSSTPGIAVRSDGRPFLYFANVGGSSGWDCANADCTSGSLREVSAAGSSTSTLTELALKSNSVPVMLYHENNANNDLYVFICSDTNCSSGDARRVVDGVGGTPLSAFSLSISADDRPVFTYQQGANRVVARCDSAHCLNVTRTSYPGSNNGRLALALRSPGIPVVLGRSNLSASLLFCAGASCLGASDTAIPEVFANTSSLIMRPGDLPMYQSASDTGVRLWRCNEPACSSTPSSTPLFTIPSNGFSLASTMAADSAGKPAISVDEFPGRTWLVLPKDLLFYDGFQ